MSKRQTIMLVGVWFVVLPFLGFPAQWEKVLAVISGLAVVWAASRLKAPERGVSGSGEDKPFTEHRS